MRREFQLWNRRGPLREATKIFFFCHRSYEIVEILLLENELMIHTLQDIYINKNNKINGKKIKLSHLIAYVGIIVIIIITEQKNYREKEKFFSEELTFLLFT